MRNFLLPPYLVKIIISYFSNRKFRILNGKSVSDYFPIDNGCVPGSCMGPLGFTLFIDDIKEAIDVPYLLYCDDLVLYTDCTDFQSGVNRMKDCLAKLETWCNDNDLQVNVEKTKSMYFFKTNDMASKLLCTNNPPTFQIYSKEIEVVSNFKYLGIIIDSNLNFRSHYRHVLNKMNSALKRLYSLRRLMSEKVVKIFLSSFVVSITDYGSNIWCAQSTTDIENLQSKINRFIVTFYMNLKYKTGEKGEKVKNMNISSLLSRIDLLTITERNKLSLLKFVYKFHSSDLFKVWFVKTLGSSYERPKFEIKRSETVIFKNSVKWRSINEWNALLSDRKIKIEMNSNDTFVDIVKEYLLKMRSDVYFYY